MSNLILANIPVFASKDVELIDIVHIIDKILLSDNH